MFEQAKPARRPYSIVVSLILQIAAIGAFCLVPFAIPNVLPTMQLKTRVLAAPPKPPVATKASASVAPVAAIRQRSFRLIPGPLLIKPTVASTSVVEIAPPGLSGAETGAGVPYGIGSATPESFPPPPPVAKPKPDSQKPIRVGTIAGANLIHMVQPAYPLLARVNHIEGTVEFTAIISKEGTIEKLVLLKGHPLLINAAKDAVLQWRYRPTLLNGQPVEVITDIVVNFALSR